MKEPIARLIPLLAKGIASAAAVAFGLLYPPAHGASGDLYPAFRDVDLKPSLSVPATAIVEATPAGDGDSFTIWTPVAISDDGTHEPSEAFMVKLSASRGRAVVGEQSTPTVSLDVSTRQQPASAPQSLWRSSRLGFVLLFLIGVVGTFCLAWKAVRLLRHPGSSP
jgi:hypothetical protein